jgi:serine protease Do
MEKLYKIVLCISMIIIFFIGGFFYFLEKDLYHSAKAVDLRLDDQDATIMAIKKIKPAVVSIIVYNENSALNYDLSTGSSSVQKEKVQKGSGTGFLISADGYILTNKHVADAVPENTGSFRIMLNSGKEYYAQLIGKDPIYDLAILKIFDKNLPFVELGNSDKLEIGTTVMAIGNTLGRYQNSATKGIVSGLGRSIIAGDQSGNDESLDNLIQTDAEINPGNSGGPLIDLKGRVVGIDVAIDTSGNSIGFAIPINDAVPIIKSVREKNQIIRPKLGIMYMMITPEMARDNKLPRDNGAWVKSNDITVSAVLAGSAADKAGIKDGDIIFEIDGIKLTSGKSLLSIVQKYKPGQKVGFKIQRGDKIFSVIAVLDKF